jgi:outer membrane protein OmpA-like peptidoglycan-associated protein
MINKTMKLSVLLLFTMLFASHQLEAQTPKDSSNAEIKKQALEMREKLNNYLADKLDENKNLNSYVIKGVSGVGFMNDSLVNTILLQQIELNVLKQKYQELEALVNNLNTTNQLSAEKANGPFINPSSGENYIQYADKQLNLYFSFNDNSLNEKQIEALSKFLENKKLKRAKIISYTDWRGNAKANNQIGKKRAATVTKLLKGKVKSYTVSTDTKCKMNMTNEGLNAQWCRRIEIILE